MSSINVEDCLNSLDAYIDIMKEETARLSDMIAKLNDKIQEVETKKERLIKEQNEPKFEVAQDEKYYFVNFYSRGCNLAVASDVYVDSLGDKTRVDQNNCFETEERAKEVLDKIKFLLKLERLHDIYCPDYKPDWESPVPKYYIYNDTSETKWYSGSVGIIDDVLQVYFPSEEIAQKVCNVLNNESSAN